jgi:hypothetical protein
MVEIMAKAPHASMQESITNYYRRGHTITEVPPAVQMAFKEQIDKAFMTVFLARDGLP